MNRIVLLSHLQDLLSKLTDPDDIATLIMAIAVIEALVVGEEDAPT